MDYVRNSTSSLKLVSELLLSPESTSCQVKRLSAPELHHLQALAMTNHVIMRSFPRLGSIAELTGDHRTSSWIASEVQKESARIHHALKFLERICAALEQRGCPAIVIKSLDHWPDLGSDLDLFTSAVPTDVVKAMTSEFNA